MDFDNPRHFFVTLVTFRFLAKCNALENRSNKDWVAQTKRLARKTMDGLVLPEGSCPDPKGAGKICAAVVKTLRKRYGGKRMLDAAVVVQAPAVETEIAQCLKTHIVARSAQLIEKAKSSGGWRDVFRLLIIAAGTTVICLGLAVLL